MIQKDLIEKIYVAASMQRWMDHIRPVEFTELDKQAHKMTIAFIIAKYEELIHGKGRLGQERIVALVRHIPRPAQIPNRLSRFPRDPCLSRPAARSRSCRAGGSRRRARGHARRGARPG